MIFRGLHETVIRDIVDTISYGIDASETFGVNLRSTNSISSASSISKATEGLVLVFPHLCTENISPETGSMLTRAIETKAVSLLQIAFSAFSITNSEDAVSFVRNFHTNIGSGKMSIEKFMDAMDSIEESTRPSVEYDRRLVKAVLEEFATMPCYFEEDLLESSINDFNVINRYGKYVVTEAPRSNNALEDRTQRDIHHREKMEQDREQFSQSYWQRERQQNHSRRQDAANYKQREDQFAATQQQKQDFHNDDLKQRDTDNNFREREITNKELDTALKAQDIANKQFKDEFDALRQQILPSDVKKANDMVPTMMIINFNTKEEDGVVIRSQAIIGVKAKLYPVTSNDVINKIIVKNADSNIFLKLVRVSTRELSFIRDFIFAIDNAKLAAISCSAKGSETNRLLKTLERRAVKGKVRRKLNLQNVYKAITTLTISKDEADFIKKYNNIDVFNKNTIRKIMDQLNLMMFIVADDTEECAHIIMDSGEDNFERISYTHLDREVADGGYKKAINLMTKVMR